MEDYQLDFDCVGLEDGGKIPISHTGRGQDISPEFIIWNLSPRAKTLAVTVEDLSHPIRDFTHWVIWNLPASNHIPAGIPAGKDVPGFRGARQGVAYGRYRYAGPKPRRGKTHVYRFTVYALDTFIKLKARSRKKAFFERADGHIIQAGSITGEFE